MARHGDIENESFDSLPLPTKQIYIWGVYEPNREIYVEIGEDDSKTLAELNRLFNKSRTGMGRVIKAAPNLDYNWIVRVSGRYDFDEVTKFLTSYNFQT